MTPDVIQTIHGAEIQHGPYNDRIYLMKLGDGDPEALLSALEELAEAQGYTKIFAKIPDPEADPFLAHDYREEARVPNLYLGKTDGVFLGKYLAKDRGLEPNADDRLRIRELAFAKRGDAVSPLHPEFVITPCVADDVAEMSMIYRQVFASYPFPIHDPEYILETMQTHVSYFGVRQHGKLVALASAEKDNASLSVEMTDFATLPECLGHGLAAHLLQVMEDHVSLENIRTMFTIARAMSAGMNITFAKLGYDFGGTLVNNTNISGDIESMNVWYKPNAPVT